MKALKWVLGILAVMCAAGGAYHAGSQATRRRVLAEKERAIERTVTVEGEAAIAAAARAEVHEKAAKEASGRARRRIEAIARSDPELSEVVSALNTRPKGRQRQRSRR